MTTLYLDRATVVDRAKSDGLAGHHALAAEVRALLHAMSATKADSAVLEAASTAMRAVRERLEGGPCEPGYVRAVEGKLVGLSTLSELGPFTGQLHATAPPIDIVLGTNRVEAVATYGPAHQGAPGLVHGGLIAGAFDELLGVAQRGHRRMTVDLRISYRGAAPLGRELRYTTWLDRVEGRKAFVAGTLHDGDRLCAEASAIFVMPRTAPYGASSQQDSA